MSFRRRPESRKEGSVQLTNQTVYILASGKNGTIYIGVTSDPVKIVWQHKNCLVEGFTKRYHVHRLVWYELRENMNSAIEREKRLKEWNEHGN